MAFSSGSSRVDLVLGKLCLALGLPVVASDPSEAPRQLQPKGLPKILGEHQKLFTLVAAGLILFIRKTDVWLTPQFWAEDGKIFFEQALQQGSAAIFTPYAGYYHFLLRCIAAVAAQFDVFWAPTLYVYCSLAVLLGVVAQVFSPRIALPYKPVLALAIVLVPHAGEVFLNLANLQWITALGLLLILLKQDAKSKLEELGDAGAVLALGLTGPFVVMLLPLFALRVIRFRSRASIILLTTAFLAAAVQLHSLLTSPPMPGTELSLLEGLEVAGFRTFGRLLFGGRVGTKLGMGWIAAVGWFFGLGVVWLSWKQSGRRWELLFLWTTFLVMTAAGIARSPEKLLMYYMLGDRYFFLPNIIGSWMIIMLFPRWPRLVLLATVMSLVANSFEFRAAPFKDHHWRKTAERISAGETVHVIVNPDFMAFDHVASPRL